MTLALENGVTDTKLTHPDMVISGERHLLDVGELSSNLTKLRKMFDMLEQKSARSLRRARLPFSASLASIAFEFFTSTITTLVSRSGRLSFLIR